MKGESLKVNFQIYHYGRSKCVVKGEKMIIEVTNLVKKYKDVKVVDGLNLAIKEGEIFGILGPNGAGKTTTMNALLGLLKISEGHIRFYGKEFTHKEKEIKKRIGYVPQEYAFFPQLSALDNVIYWGKIYGLKGQELKQAVQEALETIGLWDRRKEKASNFSGGMKRRLNIACAIIHKPAILFMDEPTVGVDPQSRNNILEAVRALNKNGTTVIYTSHYMEEIEEICDRVAIMDYGKVIALGTIPELLDAGMNESRFRVELTEVSESLCEKIRKIEGVISCKVDKTTLAISLKRENNCLNEVLHKIVEGQSKVLSLSLERPNLETVFLELTGKKLRD